MLGRNPGSSSLTRSFLLKESVGDETPKKLVTEMGALSAVKLGVICILSKLALCSHGTLGSPPCVLAGLQALCAGAEAGGPVSTGMSC